MEKPVSTEMAANSKAIETRKLCERSWLGPEGHKKTHALCKESSHFSTLPAMLKAGPGVPDILSFQETAVKSPNF